MDGYDSEALVSTSGSDGWVRDMTTHVDRDGVTMGNARSNKPASPPHRSRTSTTRTRRRDEIIQLRSMIQALESQVVTLQHKMDPAEGTASCETTTILTRMRVDVWRGIAQRRHRQRHASEQERKKLRSQLMDYVAVAQDLMETIKKAQRVQTDPSFLSSSQRGTTPLVDPTLDGRPGSQLARVEHLYRTMDDAFVDARFRDVTAGPTAKFVDLQVAHDAYEMTIDIQESWPLPFDASDVFHAVWKYRITEYIDEWCPATRLEKSVTDDVLVCVAVMTTIDKALTGSMTGQITAKKFAGHRDATGLPPVIVSNLSSKPHAVSPGHLSGIYVNQDLWMRVLPSGTGRSSVQCSNKYRISFDNIARGNRQCARALTEFLVDKINQEIEFRHEIVESTLLRG